MVRRRKRKTRTAQQVRFKRAAKKCKGRKLKAFRICMRKALRKRGIRRKRR